MLVYLPANAFCMLPAAPGVTPQWNGEYMPSPQGYGLPSPASGMISDSVGAPQEPPAIVPNAESAEATPIAQKQSTQKKRRRGGGKRNNTKPTVEDHQDDGGAGEALSRAFSNCSSASSQPAAKATKASHKGKKPQTQAVSSAKENAATRSNQSGSAYEEIVKLGEDKERCNEIVADLESGTPGAVSSFLDKYSPMAKELALCTHGCRVVQTALEKGSGKDHNRLAAVLKNSLSELYQSPHGNYVVAKMVEVMPPSSLGFVLDELKGKMFKVARHQYGSRVVQRLLEHCTAEQIAHLVKELLADAEPLCRHPFCNYIIQHIFEHGEQAWKEDIVLQMAPALPSLAMHRTASHVVQKAFHNGGEGIQNTIVSTLLRAEQGSSLAEIARSRYGSYVVEELASVSDPNLYQCLRNALQESMPSLEEKDYGKRPMEKFGLWKKSGSPSSSPKSPTASDDA